MSSLKRQKDESIAVTPSSSSELPPKKAKVAGAELPQLISIRIYNDQTRASIRIYNDQTRASIVANIDRPTLIRISNFFQNLTENLDEGESEIALEEEHVYEAAELLINIVNFFHKKDEGGEIALPIQVL